MVRPAGVKLIAEHQQDGSGKERRRYQNGESGLHAMGMNAELGVFQSSGGCEAKLARYP